MEFSGSVARRAHCASGSAAGSPSRPAQTTCRGQPIRGMDRSGRCARSACALTRCRMRKRLALANTLLRELRHRDPASARPGSGLSGLLRWNEDRSGRGRPVGTSHPAHRNLTGCDFYARRRSQRGQCGACLQGSSMSWTSGSSTRARATPDPSTPARARAQTFFISLTSLLSDALASPKSIEVFGS
jgi:hypothetical protein